MISESDAYALARAFAGMEPDERVTTSGIVQMLVNNWKGRKPGASDISFAREWFGSDIIARIFAIDPNGEPPKTGREISGMIANVPVLPKAAKLSVKDVEAAKHAGTWLDEFMEWAQRRAAMTEPLFLQSGGLWLLSVAVARRAFTTLDFARIHPPIYIMWVAGTTYWRKSTGLRAVDYLCRAVFPHLLVAAQSTPEMLMARLAGQLPINIKDLSDSEQELEKNGQKYAAQRGFIADEATKLFNGKEYMKGLPELFMEMYDAPDRVIQEFKGQGKIIVNKPGLSLLMATTPARLRLAFDDTQWDDGLLARFALLTPSNRIVKRTATERFSHDAQPNHAVIAGLRKLYERLPMPAAIGDFDGPATLKSIPIPISDGALDGFNNYADAMHDFVGPDAGLDHRLTGVYGRFPVMALKVAQLLTLIDWAMGDLSIETPTIERGHWARAQMIIETWRESSHRLLSDLTQSDDMRAEDRIMDVLRRNKNRLLTARQIYRFAGIPKRRDGVDAVKSLQADGLIEEVQSGNRKGFRIVE